MFENKGFNLDITEEDKEALGAGTVDYIGFSYYMTNTVDSTAHIDVSKSLDGSSEHSVANPFIKVSDWGWAIDPEGLRYGFIYVDRNNDGSGTLERSKKDSFDWYKKVVASNGEDLG